MKKIKTLWLRFKILLLPVLVLWPESQALAQTGRYDGWGMGPGMMGNWGMGGIGMIFMMIFWILIIVGLVLLITRLVRSTGRDKASGKTGSNSALEILKERYVRGEIDKDEFEGMKKDLSA